MIGQACAMLGAASWQILASVLKMPVSGTHSIVGAVLGSTPKVMQSSFSHLLFQALLWYPNAGKESSGGQFSKLVCFLLYFYIDNNV